MCYHMCESLYAEGSEEDTRGQLLCDSTHLKVHGVLKRLELENTVTVARASEKQKKKKMGIC